MEQCSRYEGLFFDEQGGVLEFRQLVRLLELTKEGDNLDFKVGQHLSDIMSRFDMNQS